MFQHSHLFSCPIFSPPEGGRKYKLKHFLFFSPFGGGKQQQLNACQHSQKEHIPSDLQGTHGFAGAFQFHKPGTASGEENDTVRHSVKAGRYELQRDTSHIFRRFYEFSLDSLFIHCLPPSVTGHSRHNFPPIFTTRVFALTVSASGFIKAVLNIRGNSCVVRVRYVLLMYRRCLPYRG